MLTTESFLRNVNVGIKPRQRIVFEGLEFALSAVHAAYHELRASARLIAASSMEELPEQPVDPLFLNAWSIIDYSHIARSLLRTLPSDPGYSKYIEATAGATKLRNPFHHLHSNINNLSRMERTPPLFGALSIHAVDEGDVVVGTDGVSHLRGFRVIVLTSGKSVEPHYQLYENSPDQAIEVPVGRFLLQAFGEIVNLSALFMRQKRYVGILTQ